jgi:hypothetical protein
MLGIVKPFVCLKIRLTDGSLYLPGNQIDWVKYPDNTRK